MSELIESQTALITQLGDDADYEEIASGSEFLGRLDLYSKQQQVTEGQIGAGHYGIWISATKILDLGEEVDVYPLAKRNKAVDSSVKGAVVLSYDYRSEEFQRIAAASKKEGSGCMFGVSFLVFERKSGRFLEFFLRSKSTRPIAKNIYPYLPLTEAAIRNKAANGEDVSQLKPHDSLAITLKAQYIKKKTFGWHVPEVFKCSLPFTNLPNVERRNKETVKFLTVNEVETAESTSVR